MNYDEDPPRWTAMPDEAPELLRGAFMAGRNEGPSKAQMQKLALKIAVLSAGGAVALGTAKAAAGSKVAASAASWSLAKLAGVLIVAGGIATGAVIWNRSPQPAPSASAARSPAAPVAAEQALPAQLEGAAQAAPAAMAAGQPVITSLSVPTQPEPAAADEPTARNEVAPAAAATASSAPARRAIAAHTTHAPKTARPEQRAESQAENPELAPESAGAGPAPTEIELLRRAQLALRARPREAYQLTEEHRQRFPNGAFALERDALAIQALIRAGDPAMARDLAESFLKAHPDSPHAHRFREAMGIR
jgi:hypothetical protein